jgi:hypothetical protein
MATSTSNLPAYFNNAADFQTWCAGIIAALTTGGGSLTQTTDTGQINTGTVAAPSVSQTASGYAIFKFNDALQATSPVFIKMEFGSAYTVTTPSMWVTIGTGTNGAGTLTGATTTRQMFASTSAKSAGVTLPTYVQGDGGGFVIASAYDSTAPGPMMFCAVDRTCDGTGAATSDGIFQITSGQAGGNSVNSSAQCIASGNTSNQVTANSQGQSVAWASPDFSTPIMGGGFRLIGLNIGVVPAMVMCGQLRFLKRFVFYNVNDMAGSAVPVSITNLGAAHTYLLMQRLTNLNCFSIAEVMAMLWE